MNAHSLEKKLNRMLYKLYPGQFSVQVTEDSIVVKGFSEDWNQIVDVCQRCVTKNSPYHVVNDIKFLNHEPKQMIVPHKTSQQYDQKHYDVVIIGAGISGASIARELARFDLSILLLDKETDVAMHASSKNDGEVHPGVDLPKGSLKQKYVVRGNRMYDRICKELDVPFYRRGQYVGFTQAWLRPVVEAFALQRRVECGVDDTRVISAKEAFKREPNLSKDIQFVLYNPSAGCVSPYGLTIAYAENAVMNGAEIALNTAVLGMEVQKGKIVSIQTNQGTIYPKIVINCAGVFAEDIARMAKDRFYSIHPRRGTDLILDKKANFLTKSIVSTKTLGQQGNQHTKGGGIMRTVEDTILVGPNAQETYEKEDFSTYPEDIDAIIARQSRTCPKLAKKDVIAYYTGIRAATFEEDYILEWGHHTKNLYHVAGIQSPGLTTAPAVAVDVSHAVVERLRIYQEVKENKAFDPIRKGIPMLRTMSLQERNDLVRKNPDYGIMVCRCEEISKGEILDALRSPLKVHTLDAVKRRCRPGMGRCQGGFCAPLVAKMISDEYQIPLEEVIKSTDGSNLVYKSKKGGASH